MVPMATRLRKDTTTLQAFTDYIITSRKTTRSLLTCFMTLGGLLIRPVHCKISVRYRVKKKIENCVYSSAFIRRKASLGSLALFQCHLCLTSEMFCPAAHHCSYGLVHPSCPLEECGLGLRSLAGHSSYDVGFCLFDAGAVHQVMWDFVF